MSPLINSKLSLWGIVGALALSCSAKEAARGSEVVDSSDGSEAAPSNSSATSPVAPGTTTNISSNGAAETETASAPSTSGSPTSGSPTSGTSTSGTSTSGTSTSGTPTTSGSDTASTSAVEPDVSESNDSTPSTTSAGDTETTSETTDDPDESTGSSSSADTGETEPGPGGDGPCIGGKWTTTDVTQPGPFETVEEEVNGAVLYRPSELLTGCLYPTITWGHGAGGQPSNYTAVLHTLASHGFVVIASTAGNVQDGGNSGNQFRNGMVQVAEWVLEQNGDSSSPLFEKIDPDKVGASGHSQGGYGASEAGQNPLITTSVSISGAVGSTNQNGPAFIICGGQDPFDGARCDDHPSEAYNGTSGVPVFFGTALDADHGNWGFGASTPSAPHDIVQATLAWFRYYLMEDEAYRSWFFGPDCHLCDHANWTVQSKGLE